MFKITQNNTTIYPHIQKSNFCLSLRWLNFPHPHNAEEEKEISSCPHKVALWFF